MRGLSIGSGSSERCETPLMAVGREVSGIDKCLERDCWRDGEVESPRASDCILASIESDPERAQWSGVRTMLGENVGRKGPGAVKYSGCGCWIVRRGGACGDDSSSSVDSSSELDMDSPEEEEASSLASSSSSSSEAGAAAGICSGWVLSSVGSRGRAVHIHGVVWCAAPSSWPATISGMSL